MSRIDFIGSDVNGFGKHSKLWKKKNSQTGTQQ